MHRRAFFANMKRSNAENGNLMADNINIVNHNDNLLVLKLAV